MNYLYNALWVALGQCVVAGILYLAPGFELLQRYNDAPFPARWLMAFTFMLMFFAFIMSAKDLLEKRTDTVSKITFNLFKWVFAFCDIQLNVNSMSVIFWQAANHNSEGWLLTSRLRYLIDVGEFEIGEGIKPDWRYYRAVQIGRIVDSIDPGHTGRTR